MGNAPNQQLRTVTVLLNTRNQAQLERLATAVSTPGSGQYKHYISAATFHANFSPMQATVAGVVSYLTASGLHIQSIPDNRLYIRAMGTDAAISRAFATQLSVFSVNGARRVAPSSQLSMPASVAASVAGVDGLADGVGRSTPNHVNEAAVAAVTPADTLPGPPAAFVNAPPCSQYWAQKIDTTDPAPATGKPYVPCGYVPSQLRGAYGVTSAVNSGINGSGITVGVVDAYAARTILSDANTYAASHGDPQFAPGQFHQANAGTYDLTGASDCGAQGWYGEETLDVEAVHGMAPGANIIYAGATDCNDAALLDRENYLIDNQLVQIITNSWGGFGDIDQLAPNLQKAYTHTFLQAVTEGIGIQFSSGDYGDELVHGVRTVDFPASDPWVTAVGGTSLQIGQANNYILEAGWGTTSSKLVSGAWTTPAYLYGAGGGTSTVFNEPSYQQGVVPASLAAYWGGKNRVVPDVAMDADPQTGMLIGETQAFPATGGRKAGNYYGEYRLGGTSLASPLFAGMMALADQASGRTIGFANPALYGTLKSNGYYSSSHTSGAFHDVTYHPFSMVRVNYVNSIDDSAGTSRYLRYTDQTGTLHTTPGYDDVTGIGTPYGLNFLSDVGFCC
ncbi:MAG TPA: S53 family peptidase [Candidatus Deferrimicrobium sp.]|nr:S53 family peptidase [Candidatus Deferrimicrobium sp.]